MEISKLPAAQVRRWARAGLVTPTKDESGHWQYSFQDLALLRMAGQLLEARVSPNRVTRTLRRLRDELPGRPLSSVNLVVVGGRVVVRDRFASWALDSGQGELSFEMESVAARLDPAGPESAPAVLETGAGAEDLHEAALDLELAGRPDEAEAAYVAALAKDPSLVDARINLGRLLHGAGRLAEAEALYRAALEQDAGNALAAFNLGVVLEDQKRADAAIEAYRRAIAIDDSHADAHFNLGRLLEAQGDRQAALRHLSRFRRLTR